MNNPGSFDIFPSDVLGFDADDTLWYSSTHYDTFKSALLDAEQRDPRLTGLLDEVRNIQRSQGSGESDFARYATVTARRLGASRPDLEVIIAASMELLTHPIELLPELEEFLEFTRDYRKVIITKGTEASQGRKLGLFTLATRFESTFIVPQKDSTTYGGILSKIGVRPARFIMIGDSINHDVAPVIQLRGRAVWMNAFSRMRHKGTAVPAGTLHVTGWGELKGKLTLCAS